MISNVYDKFKQMWYTYFRIVIELTYPKASGQVNGDVNNLQRNLSSVWMMKWICWYDVERDHTDDVHDL